MQQDVTQGRRHRTAVNLEQIRRHYRLSHAALAEAVGMSRAAVQARCAGTTAITGPEFDLFAEALDVEPPVFLLPEGEALRWVLDHPSARLAIRSRCFDGEDFVPEADISVLSGLPAAA